MKLLRGGLMAGLSLASLLVVSPRALAAPVSAADADGTPDLLTELQFNATMAMKSTTEATSTTSKTLASIPSTLIGTPGWVIGAQNGGAIGISETSAVSATSPPLSSASSVDAIEGSYPQPFGEGGQYMWADYSVANLNTNDIYMEFWAKMPEAKEGCKFLKIFGKGSSTTGLSDTTFATDYTGVDYGAIRQITFGDGSQLTNDGQNVINLNGTNPKWIGRSYGTAVVKTSQMSIFSSTDWGTTWHHFRIHVKYNSGTTSQNEVANGEYYLEIDGKVYVDATALYNRNPANASINYIEFFGWAQTESQPFQLWFDDIRISTGGFMSQPMPDPPANVGAE